MLSILSKGEAVLYSIATEAGDLITTEFGVNIIAENDDTASSSQWLPIEQEEYYITEKANGLDTVTFSISINDPIYALMEELNSVRDDDGQRYLITKIDAGNETAKVVCDLDLDDWKASFYHNYNSGTNRVANIIASILPTGWRGYDAAHITFARTIAGDLTPYDIAMACMVVFGVYLRFDTLHKYVYIYPQTVPAPAGSYLTRELNLTELNYKADATGFITRLYPYGKNGMTIEAVNNGLPYIDNNTYSSRVISAVWSDERYTDAESLMQDAKKRLGAMAKPSRAYSCKVLDLKAGSVSGRSDLNLDLYSSTRLIDDVRGTVTVYQIIERRRYPRYPEKNSVTLSTVPASIQNQVTQIKQAVDNPNSAFRQIIDAQIDNATEWLTAADGYVVAVEENNAWKELLFLDTPDTETAQNVLRINTNGIGFSTTGVNGPYTNAWTIDGQLVADFITAGTMSADRISGGTLTLGGESNGDGLIVMNNAAGTEIGRWDNSGITMKAGDIQFGTGYRIRSEYNDETYMELINARYWAGKIVNGSDQPFFVMDSLNTFTLDGVQTDFGGIINTNGPMAIITTGSNGLYIGADSDFPADNFTYYALIDRSKSWFANLQAGNGATLAQRVCIPYSINANGTVASWYYAYVKNGIVTPG